MMTRILLLSTALALGGCAATIPPVQVTRFHLGSEIVRAPVALVSVGSSLERAAYDAAVARELARLGFAAGASEARYTFSTEVTRGGNKSREIIVTRLSVQLRERGGKGVIWEGRAETEAPSNAPASQPGLAADKLAAALFKDFPGESGRTISVP
jgi:hypothetical protein